MPNETIYPFQKDSLLKTFIRSFIGGIGWILGITVGSAVVAGLIIRLLNVFGFGNIFEQYLQNIR